MVRFRICIFAGFALLPAFPLFADPVEQTLAIQKAMATGRVLLEQNRPREAVEVLQKELLRVDGNGKYLQLLRDAYAARLKELQLLQANPEEIETVRRQLAILDRDAKGQSKGEVKVTAAAAEPTPPEPTPPEPTPPNRPAPKPERPEQTEDPFQQVPLDPPPSGASDRPSPAPKPRRTEPSEGAVPPRPDRQVKLETPVGGDPCAQALAAFEKQKYREANRLFQQIPLTELGDKEKIAWGYAKLHEVSTLLNKTGDEAVPVAQLQAETKLALRLGGDNLRVWGQQVLGELAKRKSTPNAPAAVPEGWEVVEGANFRVVHKQMNDLANEVLRGAELARSAMYERWSGPVAAGWTPKCEVWLHPTGDYTQATSLPATSPGHSTIDLRGSKVSARRIDLRADVSDLIDTIMPHEVTYLIVQELFGEQPVPRWAEVAMTVMSEPPSQVSRYLRAVPKLAQEKRLMPVSKLMNTTEFPDAASATPFFVESVSLVDYLVRLKGAKAFAVFLREAPRRGYEKALQTHYGFKDANELQDKWLKYASGQ